MQIRDRIKKLTRVKASSLLVNPKNFRVHNDKQRAALKEILEEVGISVAAIVRELPDGKLMLIDGHLRREELEKLGDQKVPVLVLDVDEEEATKLLLTIDPLAAMADTDPEKLKKCIVSVGEVGDGMMSMFQETAGEAGAAFTKDELALTEVPLGDLNPDDIPESAVRMVQMYLTQSTYPTFQKRLKFLKKVYQVKGITEIIYQAVENEYNAQLAKKEEEAVA